MERNGKKKGAEIMSLWIVVPVCLIVGACIGVFLVALLQASKRGNGGE